MDGMVIVLPLVLVLLAFGLMSGAAYTVVLLPVVLLLGAGVVFINIALQEGRRPPDRSVRQLPTDHLQRKMYMALRPRRSRRRPDGDAEGE